jgi:hypothetical protein
MAVSELSGRGDSMRSQPARTPARTASLLCRCNAISDSNAAALSETGQATRAARRFSVADRQEIRRQIRDAILDSPAASDREIARSLGSCSPPTVGKVRRELVALAGSATTDSLASAIGELPISDVVVLPELPELTRPWMLLFLQGLTRTGMVAAACRLAGISRQTAYVHRASDEVFRLAWFETTEAVADVIEAALVRRAIGSDTIAAIFLLKCLRPDVYSDRVELRHVGSVDHQLSVLPLGVTPAQVPAAARQEAARLLLEQALEPPNGGDTDGAAR